MNPTKKLILNAQCMAESAEELSKGITGPGKNTATDGALFMGSVVLYAFSIELFLKAINASLNNGDFIRVHDLKKLFDNIPKESVKANIKDVYKQLYNEDLNVFLNANRSTFTEWRYFFEAQESLKFDLSGAQVLLKILGPIALGLFEKFQPGEQP